MPTSSRTSRLRALFQRLARLHVPRDHAIAARRETMVAGQQQARPLRRRAHHRDDDRRREPGIADQATAAGSAWRARWAMVSVGAPHCPQNWCVRSQATIWIARPARPNCVSSSWPIELAASHPRPSLRARPHLGGNLGGVAMGLRGVGPGADSPGRRCRVERQAQWADIGHQRHLAPGGRRMPHDQLIALEDEPIGGRLPLSGPATHDTNFTVCCSVMVLRPLRSIFLQV